ncbi:MAG: hypothetical protein CL933_24935 [Deltaproteobacteria bacterium]|nr:hypothetical protein [Deltaproteobacteria bacterium]
MSHPGIEGKVAIVMGSGGIGEKYAMSGLTHYPTRELGHMNIRVKAIAPDPTDTQAMQSQVPYEDRSGLVASTPSPGSASRRIWRRPTTLCDCGA